MIVHILHGLTEYRVINSFIQIFFEIVFCARSKLCIVQCNCRTMEIKRIVAPGGSLLREDRNKYIAIIDDVTLLIV